MKHMVEQAGLPLRLHMDRRVTDVELLAFCGGGGACGAGSRGGCGVGGLGWMIDLERRVVEAQRPGALRGGA